MFGSDCRIDRVTHDPTKRPARAGELEGVPHLIIGPPSARGSGFTVAESQHEGPRDAVNAVSGLGVGSKIGGIRVL